MHAGIELRMPFMLSSSETQVLCTCGPSSPLILNTNSSSMSLQWNAPLQPDYVITAYTLHHQVPSLKSQSEMWAPPSMATVQFHTYNPSGILFYQINSVMTDFLGVKLHGRLPWLIFDVGSGPAVVWIQQYQNLQRWSVAHCELQNSSVMLSLYVSASVVQSPPVGSNLCDGQGHVVLFEQASNTFYITMDTVHAAAITAAIVPLLTMKHVSYPLLNAPDGFGAVSVQNVGSTYIIVSWDLPTHSNGILINFSLYCNGTLAGVLPLTVISYNTTGLLPFTLYMYMSSSLARRHCTPVGMWCWASSVLQPACPDPMEELTATPPYPSWSRTWTRVVAPGHKEHEEPLAVSIPSHHWMENYSSLGSKFRSRLGGVTSSQDAA
ncbi:hypothetical protein EMCRGX_G011499 [Ephydatia muelleri]